MNSCHVCHRGHSLSFVFGSFGSSGHSCPVKLASGAMGSPSCSGSAIAGVDPSSRQQPASSEQHFALIGCSSSTSWPLEFVPWSSVARFDFAFSSCSSGPTSTPGCFGLLFVRAVTSSDSIAQR